MAEPNSQPRPETLALLQELRKREAAGLPTGFVNCRTCDGEGCGFCTLTGTEATFASPEDRDRYYELGGDFHAWPGI